jgi:N-acetylneuraminic acid mutarotase
MHRTASAVLVWVLLAIAAGGCQSEPPPTGSVQSTGSVQFAVALKQALSSNDVTRLTVTWSGPGVDATTVELAKTNTTWGGVISGIPAGTSLTFVGEAYGSDGTKLYQGQASDKVLTANQTTLVVITLQELNPPPPFDNEAPLIASVTAEPVSVQVGGLVTLNATASDPNPGDTLSYAWSASVGTFADASSAATTWTAPATPALATLTLTVTDSQNASVSLNLVINVTQSINEGDAVIDVHFNNFPVVARVSSSAARVDKGESTTVQVSASDSDGDMLGYQWTASCPGVWSNETSSIATFTPSELPSAACNNCRLTVTVADGRGAETTGSLALCVAKPGAVVRFPPEIHHTYQSSLTAQALQELTFEVVASDPQNSAMRFDWIANTGTLGSAQGSGGRSRMVWTAPDCAVAGVNTTVTATVANDYGESATRIFSVTGLPVCAPGWAGAGSMLSEREFHKAAVLPSGKVLVTGGRYDGKALAAAEVYDPQSNAWSAVKPMTSARYNHRAVVVRRSGKELVLVAGGKNSSGTLATAEVYDPQTNEWSAVKPMTSARHNYTVTVLSSGKVLVTGGQKGSETLAAAEVYDPLTNEWSAVKPMTSARYNHRAVVVRRSGKELVLVAGGENSSGTLDTAEVYDPQTNEWSAVNSMTSGRHNHTVTVLSSGKVLVLGGGNGVNTLRTAELYDPETGSWSSLNNTNQNETGQMKIERTSHTATMLPSGKVLVAGGYQDGFAGLPALLDTAEVFDPQTKTSSYVDSMRSKRAWHTATMLPSGKVLFSGGDGATKEAELYTP